MSALAPYLAIAIRSADEKDVALIEQLARRIWPVAYVGVLEPEHIENMLMRIYDHDNLRREMREDGHRFWIASYGGKDVAYASGYREEDIVWVKKVYVDPACKQSGIGRALINTIETAFTYNARGPAREIRLLVNPNNAAAMGFYTHIGFSDVGRKPVQMGDFQFIDYIFARTIQNEKR